MTQIIKPKEPQLQVADILRNHIADYQKGYSLWPEHKKIVSDLLNCRTAHLGGKVERCDHCGTLRIVYHSCRNRHCPKCQNMPRERWLEKRKQEILPVNYFHVVSKTKELKCFNGFAIAVSCCFFFSTDV